MPGRARSANPTQAPRAGAPASRLAARRRSSAEEASRDSTRFRSLPRQRRWEKLLDELLVIRPQRRDVGPLVALRVQIVAIEPAHPTEVLAVALVHQVRIGSVTMGRVE